MKTFAVIFLTFFLLQTSLAALSCPSGFYDPGSGATLCYRCPISYTTCSSASNGTVIKQLVGYSTTVTGFVGIPFPYCTTGGVTYNKEKDVCSIECKAGCYSCSVDYDFCTECHNGYVWNPDYTCLPAVIGLEAASLALLAIGLVFLIISCCYVNKARKWNWPEMIIYESLFIQIFFYSFSSSLFSHLLLNLDFIRNKIKNSDARKCRGWLRFSPKALREFDWCGQGTINSKKSKRARK